MSIRSVIIRVIAKSDDREAGVPFVNHEYDYRLTSDDTKSSTNYSYVSQFPRISKDYCQESD